MCGVPVPSNDPAKLQNENERTGRPITRDDGLTVGNGCPNEKTYIISQIPVTPGKDRFPLAFDDFVKNENTMGIKSSIDRFKAGNQPVEKSAGP